jgi:pyruvate formate lyase activating enzyme
VEVCPQAAITLAVEESLLNAEPQRRKDAEKNLEAASQLKTLAPSRLRVKGVFTDRSKCTRCQTCIAACYAGARQFSGHEMIVAAVMAQVEREIPFYDESGGGVTFSGGEPLMQPGFLSALLRACRTQEIHTVVDTCGFANWKVFEQIRGDVDLFLYDLKHMDSDRHRAATGVPNEVILENLQKLSALGHKILVRIPLIPGINDHEKNLVESGKFLAGLPNLVGVELMGYHDLAQAKYEALGMEYSLVGTRPPSAAEMRYAAEVLNSCGLEVALR